MVALRHGSAPSPRRNNGRPQIIMCGGVGDGTSTLTERLLGDSPRGRQFSIADPPHHARYTRDMIAAASTSDVAVVLIDASRELQTQTRWRSHVVSLFGVGKIVIAVNKLDQVGYAKDVFERIQDEYQAFARSIGLHDVVCIPVSAINGDNVVTRSPEMPWYQGPTLMDYLDAIEVGDGADHDMLHASHSTPEVADQFETTIVWMVHDSMLPGRSYLLKSGATTVGATLATPKYRLNVDTLEHVAARTLQLNDIGVCNVHLDRSIAFRADVKSRNVGSFELIDRYTNETIGAGVMHFALRRAHNVRWQAVDVGKPARSKQKGHRPCVLWFTGISGAGKSTIANLVETRLHAMGLHTYLLDGDNVRHGLNRDLGFTKADRVENIRRVAEVARFMVDAGLIVLVSFISPFRAERRFARTLVETDEFCEVFVDAPLDVAEARDRKGLYRKVRLGELTNFTGIDSPYEPPEAPEVIIDTTQCTAEAAAEMVIARLRAMHVFDAPMDAGA